MKAKFIKSIDNKEKEKIEEKMELLNEKIEELTNEKIRLGYVSKESREGEESNLGESAIPPSTTLYLLGLEEIDKRASVRENLELIPYEEFEDVEYLAEGGFSKVYRAKWIKGIANDNKIGWSKKDVVLKNLNNSREVSKDFLQEVYLHGLLNLAVDVVKCYGICQNHDTNDWMIVMEYISDNNLRDYLKKHSRLKIEVKIKILCDIARGLNSIHQKGLIHKDLHCGNILVNSQENNSCYIIDLGLCQPINEKDQEKVYGVLPYVAPELLSFALNPKASNLSAPYSQGSDVYSFSMIAYEVLSGLPPHCDKSHDESLGSKICDGLRPNLDEVVFFQPLKDLIRQCWNNEPLIRPTSKKLVDVLEHWIGKSDIDYLPIISYQNHPQAVYYSRLLDNKSFPKSQNFKEIDKWFDLEKELEDEIEKIEKETNLSFENESKEMMKDFIELNQKLLKGIEDSAFEDEIEKKEKKMRKRLKEKGFSEEEIGKIVRCCEKVEIVSSNQQKGEFQAKIVEIFPKNH
ncbi:MAG: Serine/threonine-protein kinase PknD [Mycoplasmataceae bacterium]|nr:Serine/threonine-protein kinase PknD [Mycoplasmataceae bacterium]WNE41190.1 MAG: Serine/threonine-protein kinase PknD [Mycoplasmataceae bacterium]